MKAKENQKRQVGRSYLKQSQFYDRSAKQSKKFQTVDPGNDTVELDEASAENNKHLYFNAPAKKPKGKRDAYLDMLSQKQFFNRRSRASNDGESGARSDILKSQQSNRDENILGSI